VVKCLRKDKHCDICCNNFIGGEFISKIVDCVDTCNEILGFGKPPENQGYVLYTDSEETRDKKKDK